MTCNAPLLTTCVRLNNRIYTEPKRGVVETSTVNVNNSTTRNLIQKAFACVRHIFYFRKIWFLVLATLMDHEEINNFIVLLFAKDY